MSELGRGSDGTVSLGWEIPSRVTLRSEGDEWWLACEWSSGTSAADPDGLSYRASGLWAAFHQLGRYDARQGEIDRALAAKVADFVRRYGAFVRSREGSNESTRPRHQPVWNYVYHATLMRSVVKAARALKLGAEPSPNDARVLLEHIDQIAADLRAHNRVAESHRVVPSKRPVANWSQSISLPWHVAEYQAAKVAARRFTGKENCLLAEAPPLRHRDEWLAVQRERVAAIVDWWNLSGPVYGPLMVWSDRVTPWSFTPGGLWAVLGRELHSRVTAVQRREGWRLKCESCGSLFTSKRRRAKERGEKAWCRKATCQRARVKHNVEEHRRKAKTSQEA